jgi:hypothetical protein
MLVKFVPWDYALMVVVTIMATLISYLDKPKWKAFILSLPIPFTLAVLAVGQPLTIANVMGLLLLLFYTHSVRILYQRVRMPIVLAIVISAVGYCLLAALTLPVLPNTETAFWVVSLVLFVLAFILLWLLPERNETSYRSTLSFWLKLPILFSVIFLIIILKGILQGYMTLFPMVGVVASYEARNSLWTIGRQIPMLMIAMIPMIDAAHFFQPYTGLGGSLAIGWGVFLAIFSLITWYDWSRSNSVNQCSRLHKLKIF